MANRDVVLVLHFALLSLNQVCLVSWVDCLSRVASGVGAVIVSWGLSCRNGFKFTLRSLDRLANKMMYLF